MREVSVIYPNARTSAPAGASLRVQRGERVLLLGPSGCGKSTLALCVNGLVPRSLPAAVRGSITVFGKNVASSQVARLSRLVGMVFQDVDAQVVMNTVLDEVCFGPENLCLPASEVTARAAAALRALGLWPKRCADPATLSGGEKQRLALACALAMGSELLVLDEPTANLDPHNCNRVYQALTQLTADGQRAVLLIEHNLDAALPFINRVVVLDTTGKTLLTGSPQTVFATHGEKLASIGVRLPAPTRISLALRRAGINAGKLAVTNDELGTIVRAHAGSIRRLLQTHGRAKTARSICPKPPILELVDVSVRRGSHIALHEVSLQVATGAFIGVIGVNGAGKTTLLQTLGGLLSPSSGTVRCAGKTMNRKHHARRVGYVFQNPEHQFVTDTVSGELELAAAKSFRDRAVQARRVAQYLERFGLGAARSRHPFLLSGGEKRRLSVATALIGGTEVLLLDEPTFGQDQAYRNELLRLLEDLHAAGTTIVMASHDLELVAACTTDSVILANGMIVSAAPTAATFSNTEALTSAGLCAPALHTLLHEYGLDVGELAHLVTAMEAR